ncbi:MAG: type II toxin-antitoxin system HicB family antitoxin [Erythrobacter sp.]|uniref:hypothetical protein n=1 Tax=Erythrobacter sp. TaxID=1042 RepID=UPI0025DE5D33|nr:hypothetical protein [Erythrobacter sp.]MCL9998130.1 type II toxin-antitoxin system HicB family antitoxin [Erythrobacter sp.]
MSDSGFASLGPSLLARKGGAKPAMRPQVAPLVTEESVVPEDKLEDLGWNDMGHDMGGDSEGEGGADIVPISADLAAGPTTAGPGPIIRRQQRRLEERVLADAAMTGPETDEYDDYEDGETLYDEALDGANYGSAGYDEDEEGEEADTAIYSPLAPHITLPEPQPAPMPAAAPRAAVRVRVVAPQSARRAAFTLRLDADRHLKLRLAATMQGVSAQVLVTEALDRLLAEYDELDVIANHLKRH